MLFGTNLVKDTYMRYVHYPGACAPYALARINIYTYVAVFHHPYIATAYEKRITRLVEGIK